MKYLAIRTRKNKNKDTTSTEMVFRTKATKYGEILSTEGIKKKVKTVMIVGAHTSGKSRYLDKIRINAKNFWGKQQRPYSAKTKKVYMRNALRPERNNEEFKIPDPVYLSGLNPLASWTDNEQIKAWWGNVGYKICGEDVPWQKLPAYKKQDAIAVYLSETRAVLFIDDADKCTGKKKEIIKVCIRAAFRTVLTAKDENALDPTVRTDILHSEHQIIRLETDTAYDATAIAMWFLIVAAVAAGATEVAMILFGLKMFGAGTGGVKNATAKQN